MKVVISMFYRLKLATLCVLFMCLGACQSLSNQPDSKVNCCELLTENLNVGKVILINQNLIQKQANFELNEVEKSSKQHIGGTYTLGIGDVLSIRVWHLPEVGKANESSVLSSVKEVQVQEDGTISFPYAPNIPAQNKTLADVKIALENRLKRIVESPQVHLKITEFRSQKIYVSGAVDKAGSYSITDISKTLTDALFEAGLSLPINELEVRLIRNSSVKVIDLSNLSATGSLKENPVILSSDILYVSKKPDAEIYFVSDFTKNNVLKLKKETSSIANALKMISPEVGLDDASALFVLRKQIDNSLVIYQLVLQKIDTELLSGQFKLQSGDILYLTKAPKSSWLRTISELIEVL